jgi:hypothetical protein
VENRALCIEGLAMSVGGGGRVEQVCEMELGFWGDMGLVLEDKDLMLEEGFANDGEVGICEELELCMRGDAVLTRLTQRWLPIHGVHHMCISSFPTAYRPLLTGQVFNINAINNGAER